MATTIQSQFESIVYAWQAVPVAWSLINNKVPQNVPLDGTPIGVTDLAYKCQVDAIALYKFMKLLSGLGVFYEDPVGTFRHNELSQRLVPGRDLEAMVPFMGGKLYLQSASKLNKFLRRGGLKTPFEMFHRESIYHHFSKNLISQKRFCHFSSVTTQPFVEAIVANLNLPQRGIIAEISDGFSDVMFESLRQRPDMTGIIFENEHTAAMIAGAMLDPRSVDPIFIKYTADIRKRVEVISGDILKQADWKKLERADVLFMKRTLAEHSEADARRILANLYATAKMDALILICESVIPSTFNQHLPVHTVDINLAVMSGGKERNRTEWHDLLVSGPGYQYDVHISEPIDQCMQMHIMKLTKKVTYV